MPFPENHYFNRDASWLGFNHRVLQEAADTSVPLLERFNFLSIYSSNLDEFYRVRIPTLLSLQKLVTSASSVDYTERLKNLQDTVYGQMKELGAIITESLLPELKKNHIHLLYNEPIPDIIKEEVRAYFFLQVVGYLQPVMLGNAKSVFLVENNKLQILVVLADKDEQEKLVIVNIPTDVVPRFFGVNEPKSGMQYILFLDDIIKENLKHIYIGYQVKATYSFKITRDASLDLHDEFVGNIAETIGSQLQKRDAGFATRFLYQPGIPLRLLYRVKEYLNLKNANAISGGNYHNLKDLRSLPLKNKQALSYPAWIPNATQLKNEEGSIFNLLAEKDWMVHTPYQSYYPVTRFFSEAMIDQTVTEIYVTIYRVAADSMLVNSLIAAARNGKAVTVFVELKARFDEANNLKWAARMKEAGVKIIYSIPGLKVHAKVALVKRKENGRIKAYGLLSTGNFNENTALLYTDHILLTANAGIVRELELLFLFFGFRKQPEKSAGAYFEHLLLARFNMQEKFLQLMANEIEAAKQGKEAFITIKINSLEDQVLINKLYEASQAGVKIQLLVRSICCLVPGVSGMSENISVTRIVDRFLEHGRIFVFHNNGLPKVFMGSADWMNRSMYHRIEVCFPVYDEAIKNELLQLLAIQLSDNVKAVTINEQMQQIRKVNNAEPIRSQEKIYQLLLQK